MAQNRRQFLQTSAAASAAAAITPMWFPTESLSGEGSKSPNARPVLGCIGTGSRWNAVGPNAMKFADCVAVCDVDKGHMGKAVNRVGKDKKGGAKAKTYDDYRKLLERKDINVVTIVTPDHWHTKIAIDAMRAGKDVYCEKPLTLTIEEGKQIRKVLKETGRVFQVGTQQRSEMGMRFVKATALIREGRIGEVKKLQCAIGGAPRSGAIPKADVPGGLNWEKWLGQAPMTDYRFKKAGRRGNSRCHYEFRWWYEYSGGKMTDWGAHHVDIATWMIDAGNTGPISVEPKMDKVEHPVELKNGMPTRDDEYNAATKFLVVASFENGIKMGIRHDSANGILVEGTKGRIFVSRGQLKGDAVDELKKKPLSEETFKTLYKGKKPGGGNAHMRNFFECIADRTQPVSDVDTHHRAMTTCHLANIAIRLGRTIKWDPKKEEIVGDKDAANWVRRDQRKGYQIDVSV